MLRFLFVVAAYSLIVLLISFSSLGFNMVEFISLIVWFVTVGIIVLLTASGRLELAVNLFILGGLAKGFELLFKPIGLYFFVHLALIAFIAAAVHLKKYQLYGTFLITYLMQLYFAFTPTEGSLQTTEAALTSYRISIVIGVLMFLVSILYLSGIVDREIEKAVLLHHISRTDTLTGIPNRNSYNLYTQKMQSDTSYSLMILDLDHFKQVNDTYGHPVGDKVLVQFAEALRSLVFDRDSVFRLGGEEFCVILKNLSEAEAYAVSLRILKGIRTTDFKLSVPLTTSIGMVHLEAGWKAESMETYYSNADRALYLAKSEGRDRVRVHKF